MQMAKVKPYDDTSRWRIEESGDEWEVLRGPVQYKWVRGNKPSYYVASKDGNWVIYWPAEYVEIVK